MEELCILLFPSLLPSICHWSIIRVIFITRQHHQNLHRNTFRIFILNIFNWQCNRLDWSIGEQILQLHPEFWFCLFRHTLYHRILEIAFKKVQDSLRKFLSWGQESTILYLRLRRHKIKLKFMPKFWFSRALGPNSQNISHFSTSLKV